MSVLSALVPLPTRIPESVEEPVPPFPTPNVPVRRLVPILVVAMTLPFASVERTLLVRFVIANDVEVADPKLFAPVHVLLSESSVVDAPVKVV